MIVFNNVEVRDHLHLILDHFSALSPDDRYNRFFNTMGPGAIRDWILSVTENSYSHYFFVEEGDDGRFIGVSVLGIIPGMNIAGIGISVLPEHRGKGVAKKLLSETIRVAKNLRVSDLEFECLLGNLESKKLFTHFGFSSHYDQEQQCVVGHLKLVE